MALKQADCETREGCQYEAGMGLMEEKDYQHIPDTVCRPDLTPLSEAEISSTIILYKIETTGSGMFYLFDIWNTIFV